VRIARIAHEDATVRILVDVDGAVKMLAADASRDVLSQLEHASSLDPLPTRLKNLALEGSDLEGPIPGTWLTPVPVAEAWACGVTFARQAKEHEDDLEKGGDSGRGLYDYVYASERPEVFFKGFGRTMVPHEGTVMLRSDSRLTMPEAEMVVVLGRGGVVLGFCSGNDLTAWDLEKECPLFLNQAKIWDGSGSLGPWMVLAESGFDPYDVTLTCRVHRGDEVVLDSVGSTSGLRRSVPELVHYLRRHNSVPPFSVLFTGTVCVTPHEFTMESGDLVEVIADDFGILSNHVLQFDPPAEPAPKPRIES